MGNAKLYAVLLSDGNTPNVNRDKSHPNYSHFTMQKWESYIVTTTKHGSRRYVTMIKQPSNPLDSLRKRLQMFFCIWSTKLDCENECNGNRHNKFSKSPSEKHKQSRGEVTTDKTIPMSSWKWKDRRTWSGVNSGR